MTKPLSIDRLLSAVGGDAAAFRTRIALEPAGGPGDKVFPPTYTGGEYATEERRLPGYENPVPCVVLDSVQSQANRVEEALQDAIDEGRLTLPVVAVDFDQVPLVDPESNDEGIVERIGRITSLEAPHRIADAVLRDSEDFDGVAFRKTSAGQKLDSANIRDATPVYQICPTALLLGLWDSTGPKGGLGVKFQRALVSEIVGINAVAGTRSSSRLDPLAISASATIYEAADGSGWTTEAGEAREHKKKPNLFKKDGKPSEVNHSNIAPTLEPGKGGVTIDSASMTTVISLAALRRLRFPVACEQSHERNVAGRAVIAAIGLAGVALSLERGLDLRSRCLLVSGAESNWELLSTVGAEVEQFSMDASSALKLLESAIAHAEKQGLTWEKEAILLRPSAKLVKLVRKSQLIALTKNGDQGDDE